MRVSRDRLITIGIAALASVAVLGWIREPEKHRLPDRSERTTFQPPLDTTGPPVIRELPGDPVQIERPAPYVRRLPALSDHPTRQDTLAVTLPRQTAPVEHDDRTRTRAEQRREDQIRTRAPEPEYRRESSNDGHEVDQAGVTPRVTSAPVAGEKERSVGRSAAIIAGAAAAGAAIAGLSSGGKGAAIGAVAGGAGGYVYDRMTRSRSAPAAGPDVTDRDSSASSNGYNQVSTAQQFGTPRFFGN
jgi:hypothetical protein